MGILDMIFAGKPVQKGGAQRADPERSAERLQEPARQADALQPGEGGPQRDPLDERLAAVVGKVVEVMRDHAPDGPYHVAFCIPGSQNEGHFLLKLTRPGDWQLQIGAMRIGTDMLVSHYLCHGELEKVLAYLAKPDLQEELARSAKKLSASVDDRL